MFSFPIFQYIIEILRFYIHTLFFLFASSDKMHLHLLAKLAHLTRDVGSLDFLSQKPTKPNLLQYVKNWEVGLRPNLFK